MLSSTAVTVNISGALTTSKRDGRLSIAFLVVSSRFGVGGAGSARLTRLNGGGSSFNDVIASSYILIHSLVKENINITEQQIECNAKYLLDSRFLLPLSSHLQSSFTADMSLNKTNQFRPLDGTEQDHVI